jgi:hypothetical protein
MSFGVVVLIVLATWSLLSIVVSVAFGGMAQGRDTVPAHDEERRPREDAFRRHVAS